jgi:galactokinase
MRAQSPISAFAPGRVNLIGEHTDYNCGLALPFAIRDGVTVRASRQAGRRIRAFARDLDAHDEFELDAVQATEGWRAFVRGAAAELQRAGIELEGARLEITGTVPKGAGLSSSAALGVALMLALCAVSGVTAPPPLELARLCARVERGWIGAETGLLDQLASLYGREGSAVLIDFEKLDQDPAPVPLHLGAFQFIVLDSGERRNLAASGYNERARECREACRLLGVDSLRQASPQSIATLPAPLDRRARHVLSENDRVLRAVEALRDGALPEVGRLLTASHASLRDDYEVSTPAVEQAIERCREAGALGARLIGGGFGGSVLALLPGGATPPSGAVGVTPGPGASVGG